MEIRIRDTGQVITEREFRKLHNQTSFPEKLNTAILDELGADVVMEGPQASGGEFWQYSIRDGVKQINGKWYTCYVLGPIFTDIEEQDAYITQKTQERNETIFKTYQEQTQNRLDIFARTRNYDSILSLCTYATDPNLQFSREGQYGVEARSITWAKLYEIFDEIKTGIRPIPNSYEDIELELPELVWLN